MQLNTEQIGAYQRLLVSLGANSQLAKNHRPAGAREPRAIGNTFPDRPSTTGAPADPVSPGGGATGGNFTDKPGIEDGDDNRPSRRCK